MFRAPGTRDARTIVKKNRMKNLIYIYIYITLSGNKRIQEPVQKNRSARMRIGHKNNMAVITEGKESKGEEERNGKRERKRKRKRKRKGKEEFHKNRDIQNVLDTRK